MSTESQDSQPAEPTPSVDGLPVYEPPRLTYVGNLRDLLGKTGGRPDNSRRIPAPTRP